MLKVITALSLVFILLEAGTMLFVAHTVGVAYAPVVHGASSGSPSSFFQMVDSWRTSADRLTQITSSLP